MAFVILVSDNSMKGSVEPELLHHMLQILEDPAFQVPGLVRAYLKEYLVLSSYKHGGCRCGQDLSPLPDQLLLAALHTVTPALPCCSSCSRATASHDQIFLQAWSAGLEVVVLQHG